MLIFLLDAHDVLHMKVITSLDEAEPSELFIFRNGCLVFWNVAESTVREKNLITLIISARLCETM